MFQRYIALTIVNIPFHTPECHVYTINYIILSLESYQFLSTDPSDFLQLILTCNLPEIWVLSQSDKLYVLLFAPQKCLARCGFSYFPSLLPIQILDVSLLFFTEQLDIIAIDSFYILTVGTVSCCLRKRYLDRCSRKFLLFCKILGLRAFRFQFSWR